MSGTATSTGPHTSGTDVNTIIVPKESTGSSLLVWPRNSIRSPLS